jgi:hypothetical protein
LEHFTTFFLQKITLFAKSIIENYLKKLVPDCGSVVDFNRVGVISGCNPFGLQHENFNLVE